MRLIKKILLALLIVFIVAQFFGPDKNQGALTSIEPFLAETKPSTEVQAILKETCYDCHSSFTRYPWYNNITPVNYWLADHIEHGRSHFDVSNWNDYDLKKKDHKMEELIEEVKEKEMPLPSYTWTHAEADLTEDQIKAIVDWAKTVRDNYASQLEKE